MSNPKYNKAKGAAFEIDVMKWLRKMADHGTRWHEYEQRKQAYLRTHPEATQAEYARAMREIADRLGV